MLRQWESEVAVSNPSAPTLAAHILGQSQREKDMAKIDPGSVVDAYSFRKEEDVICPWEK